MRAQIYTTLFLISLCLSVPLFGQEAAGRLEGVVEDTTGVPVPFATVFIKEIAKGTVANEVGAYELNKVPAGHYTLSFSCQGYAPIEKKINLKEGESLSLRIRMSEKALQLKDAVVIGKTEVAEVREQPFAVASVDARAYHNSSGDVNSVLGRVAGVKIREEGGLGSRFEFNMNGLSGDQIKFFINGIPMETFSSSMSLNNFPANLIDRIEVYKGVVPIYLGSDALGGAVNVISRQSNSDYLDLSYSFGSFNTHRAALNGQFVNKRNGFVVKGSAFHNYSDNNYKVKVSLVDPESGQYLEEQEVRRFHDAYLSSMGQLQLGWRDRKWADELLFGFTASANEDEVQHAISLDRVFGQVTTSSHSLMPSVQYRKFDFLVKGLDVRVFSAYGNHKSAIADTSSRKYDWLGNYTIKNNKVIGEASWKKSLFNFNDENYLLNFSSNYEINPRHQFAFNYTQNFLSRTGEDPASRTKVPFEDPNNLDKRVLGMAYTFKLLDEKWVNTVFGKYFDFGAEVLAIDYKEEETHINTRFRKPGYGFASTYYILRGLQLKASFEKAYRLPAGHEMFGDGLLLISNPFLLPEESYNGNLGALWTKHVGDAAFQAEGNFFVRDVKDMIRIEATGILSQYVNQKDVKSSGMEGSFNFNYGRRLSAGINATYQNIINTTQYENGRISYVYLDRIPNIPVFFTNAHLGYHFHNAFLKEDKLSLFWKSQYIGKYFLKWPSQGNAGSKFDIPAQFIQDLELIYATSGGKYNVSLLAQNFLDATAYDHFRLQKPGRAFYLKLRYFITNQ